MSVHGHAEQGGDDATGGQETENVIVARLAVLIQPGTKHNRVKGIREIAYDGNNTHSRAGEGFFDLNFRNQRSDQTVGHHYNGTGNQRINAGKGGADVRGEEQNCAKQSSQNDKCIFL